MAEVNGSRAVLIVGAGVTGIQSALDLANAGYQVYVVESSPAIGGTVAQLDRTFPNDVPAICQIIPKVHEFSRHPNIHLISNARLSRVAGEAGAFEVTIEKEPLRVNEKCDNCGACVKVCPIKPYSTFNEGLMQRTAIDLNSSIAIPAIYNIEKETPVCQEACPVHVDIRKYVGFIAERRFEEALAVVRQRNPLPGICGRVCTHPCESACNRGKRDDPVAIDALKRFAADYELGLWREGKMQRPKPPEANLKKKVAIIGAGPAGLTVAHDVAQMGYKATIFEEATVPGGMLYLGIPEYRLPRDIIDAETDYIRAMGVDINLGVPIGKQLTIDDLIKQGYRAVFIGIGAHSGLKLGVQGEDEFEGILDCIKFLRKVNLGDEQKPGKKVIVIGGGNSAIDSARTALRLGADEVYILYRRSRSEMPANPWEIDEAEREGVKLHYLAAPVTILGSQGRVTGMQCIKMELGKLDASGRRRPMPVKGSEFEIEADIIISAISQEPDLSFLHKDHGLKISKWNSFVVDEATMRTNRPGVYAGGDAVTGPSTVIEAIAAGHRAASSIAIYLESL